MPRTYSRGLFTTFFAFLLLSQGLFANPSQLENLNVPWAAPLDTGLKDSSSSLVHNCVDAVSGAYHQSFSDLKVPGSEPLNLEISYSSLDQHLSNLGWGVRYQLPAFVQIPCAYSFYTPGGHMGNPHALVMHESGTPLWYERRTLKWSGEKQNTKKTLHHGSWEFLKQSPGLSNFRADGFSARSNLKNAKLSYNRFDKNIVQWSCASKAFHSFSCWGKHESRSRTYALRLTQKENGHQIHYSWDKDLNPQTIKATNKDQSKTCAWIKFQSTNKGSLEANLSNASKVLYTLELTHGDGHYLKSICGPNLPDRKFSYQEVPGLDTRLGAKKKLSRIDYPDNRCRVIEYYGKDCQNPVMGQDIRIKDPKDPRLGRVRRILEPVNNELKAVASFIYHLKKEKGFSQTEVFSGYTEVFDAAGNRSEYHFNKDLRLTKTIFCEGKKELYHKAFFWGENGGPDTANLLAIALCEPSGKAASLQRFSYDALGNLIKSSLFGNLSGLGPKTFSINEQGFAKEAVEEAATHYAYSKENLLVEKKDPSGLTTRYQYNEEGLPIAEFLEKNGILQRKFMAYDEDGCLKTLITDDGNSPEETNLSLVSHQKIQRFSYRKDQLKEKTGLFGLPSRIDEAYLDPSSKKDHLFKSQEFTYDAKGNVIKSSLFSQKDKVSLSYQYDSKNRKVLENDSRGRSFAWTFDANNNVLEEKGPQNRLIKRVYNLSNQVVKEISYENKEKSFGYDALGFLCKESDQQNNSTEWSNNQFGKRLEETLPEIRLFDGEKEHFASAKRRYFYDILGNCQKKIDACGNQETYAYNLYGAPTKIQYPDGSSESWQYLLDGKLQKHILKNGSYWLCSYDALGRCIHERLFSASNTFLKEKKFVYKGPFQIAEIDELGVTKHFSYNFLGQKIEEKKADAIKTFAYDAWGNLSEMVLGNKDSIIRYSYDAFHRLIDRKTFDFDQRLCLRESFAFDFFGNKTKEIQYYHNKPCTKSFSYDALDRIREISQPDGHTSSVSYSESKNDRGQRVLQKVETNAEGLKSSTTYNARGMEESIIKYSRGKARDRVDFFYDAEGRRKKLEHSVYHGSQLKLKIVTLWNYDSMGRVIQCTEAANSPHKRCSHYKYTPSGQVMRMVKADGLSLEFSYTADDLLQEQKSSDGSIHYSYSYDAKGRLLSVNEGAGKETKRQYDALDRITSEQLSNGIMLQYTFDAMDRCKELYVKDAGSVSYNYKGPLPFSTQRKDSSGNVLFTHQSSCFDQSGRCLVETLCGGLQKQTSFDNCGRIRSIQSPFYTFKDAEYSPCGNLLTCDIQKAEESFQQSYVYDILQQMTEEKGLKEQKYVFDSRKRRLQKDALQYQVNEADELCFDGENHILYDGRGNPIEEGKKRYHYDALDRLIRFENGEQSLVFSYDAFHRCTSLKELDGKEKHFIYQGTEEIGNFDASGNLESFRCLSPGKQKKSLIIELNEKAYTPLHDHNGSVIALLDPANNTLSESYHYNAFGEEEHKNALSPWRFADKRKHPHTDLISFHRRYYQPHSGRWLTPDPAGFIDGPNLYAYCHNNPFFYYDPDGLYAKEFSQGFGLAALNHGSSRLVFKGVTYLGIGLLGASASPVIAYGSLIYGASSLCYHYRNEIYNITTTIHQQGFQAGSQELGKAASQQFEHFLNASPQEQGSLAFDALALGLGCCNNLRRNANIPHGNSPPPKTLQEGVVKNNKYDKIIKGFEKLTGKNPIIEKKVGGSDLILRSQDKLHQIRFDLTNPHGLEPHVNIETFELRNLFPGDTRMKIIENLHIFPKN